MKKKQAITVLCGGQSAEHEISILSVRNVISNLDKKKFDLSVIYLSQQGGWFLIDGTQENFEEQRSQPLLLMPGNAQRPFVFFNNPNQGIAVDCVIPMLHGTGGEDGSVQGLLDILNVPYVGSTVLSSAVCMNKHIAKRLLRFAGLPTPDWVCIREDEAERFSYDLLAKELGDIIFIKPAALGSSVGISKVRNQQEFSAAIRNAFQYDSVVIAERAVIAREIECSVLGNDKPVASLPGELHTTHEFYSYEAKYLDSDNLTFTTPADLPEATVRIVQELAIEAFKALQCSGMARVDFFITEAQEIFINEINTIPGFTSMSMYPINWQVSGLTSKELIESLIQLAIAFHHRRSELSRYYLNGSEVGNDVPSTGKNGNE